MRHVVASSEVAHIWANPRTENDSARNARGSIYFKGPTIYSYGSHFPMATIHNGGSRRLVLVNPASYSITTSGHQSMARGAVTHLQTVSVPNLTPYDAEDHKLNLAYLVKRADEVEGEARRARKPATKAYRAEAAVALIEDGRAYARFFKIRVPRVPVRFKELAVMAARWHSEHAEYRARVEHAQREEEKEKLAAWLRGEQVHGGLWYSDTQLRVVGDTVETSKGVSFPLEHARRAYRLVKILRARGGTFKRNGGEIRLGHYRIESIDAEGTIKAGCHIVKWAAVERIADKLEG